MGVSIGHVRLPECCWHLVLLGQNHLRNKHLDVTSHDTGWSQKGASYEQIAIFINRVVV